MKKIVLSVVSLIIILGSMPIVVSAQDKKQVMTTFYPVYFLAEQIAGQAADVEMLLDQGQDAHSYEVSAQDAVKVQEADLLIYQDDEFEYFVTDLMNLMDQNLTKVIESTHGLDLLAGDSNHDHEEEEHKEEDHEEEHGEEAHNHKHEYDPHTWLDPIFYAKQAENIKLALVEMDPENKEIYEANAKQLIDKLQQLDTTYREGLKDLENQTIVVQHQAFGYLTNAYGLQQVAITGIQTNQEPSAKVLAEMQDFVNEHDIQVIFVDPAMSTSISETIANATGAELRPLRTLEVVTQDERIQGKDYFSIMLDNLDELIK